MNIVGRGANLSGYYKATSQAVASGLKPAAVAVPVTKESPTFVHPASTVSCALQGNVPTGWISAKSALTGRLSLATSLACSLYCDVEENCDLVGYITCDVVVVVVLAHHNILTHTCLEFIYRPCPSATLPHRPEGARLLRLPTRWRQVGQPQGRERRVAQGLHLPAGRKYDC